MLDEEEHLDQNLLSAGAIGMDGENNQLKMLRCSVVIVIFIYLARPFSLVIVVTNWDMSRRS